jgi:general secretion pathway protein E
MKKEDLPSSPTPRAKLSFREELTRVLMTDMRDLFRRAETQGGAVPEMEEAATQLAEDLLFDAVRERATDIHIDPLSQGSRIRLRVDGRVVDSAELDRAYTQRLVNQIKTLADIDPVRSFKPHDARFTYDLDGRMIDVRVTTVPSVTGDKISIRLLDPVRARQDIGELGLSPADEEQLKSWLDGTTGLFLVTGPTGSGKTTLLYALLHELRQRDWAIMTIEDPVEYQIDGITQIQVDERHGLNFATGLRTMLRLDPDYLMLGEIRDRESAGSALDASISGRALMSTLHTRNAVATLSALRNWGASDLEIAVSLSVVVAQRLVRTLCEHCKEEGPITDAQRAWVEAAGGEAPDLVWEPKGCDACHNLGFVGRTGVFETWRLDDSDYELILSGVDEHAMARHLAKKGHKTLVMDGIDKVRAGITSISELYRMPDVEAPPARPEPVAVEV